MKTWWEQFPGRLEYELEALTRAGIEYEQPLRNNETGVVSLTVKVRQKDQLLELRAEYPPFFPFVRFEVFAPDLTLSRHQHPFSKNLCLLGRSSTNWDVYDTLAGILTSQIPDLLHAVAEQDRRAVEGIEEQQPEPFSYYYDYCANSMVYVDSDWLIDAAIGRGRFQLEIESLSPFRAWVIHVEDGDSNEIAKAKWSSGRGEAIKGRWIRSNTEIRERSAVSILKEAKALNQSLSDPHWCSAFQEKVDVVGIVYPEETQWRTRSDGWLFILRVQHKHVRAGFRRGKTYDTYLLRTGRAGSSDVQSRAPELKNIQGKRIAIVGCGALGGPTAIECARCGVSGLNLMDNDFVEPGNSVRWPLGFSAAGYLKTDALASFIKQNYPYVNVRPFSNRLGAPVSLGGAIPTQYDEFLDGAHLIIDCTAEPGIHYPLSQLSRERKIPYVAMSGTPGLWGGRVFRFVPGKTVGCWSCLCYWLDEKVIPSPPEDPDGKIVPVGCAEPTFTGASYNALQIASFGMRFAVDALNPAPQFEFDVCNVAFNSAVGAKIVPTWTHHKIERHPKCENH
jgi:molybdopterin/thiamine biosynthesis adenylyltransferase